MGLKILDNLKKAVKDQGQNLPQEDIYGNDYYAGDGYDDDGLGMDEGQNNESLFDSQEEQTRNVGAPQRPATTLKVIKPTSYADGPDIADKLMDGSTVVLNLEEMNKESAIRLIDFLLGVAHVLEADMKKVSANTIVIAPGGIDEADSDDDGSLQNV